MAWNEEGLKEPAVTAWVDQDFAVASYMYTELGWAESAPMTYIAL
jgi:hypothetical protein